MSWTRWALPRPGPEPGAAVRRAFDELYRRALAAGPTQPLHYDVDAPVWQFLCHLGDTGRVVLHGSGRDDITRFEPRQSDDLEPFGAQRAVYASSDGIWPLFFAVLDRARYRGTLVNTCARSGDERSPRYFFSLEHRQLGEAPWRPGAVYLLPPATFVPEPGRGHGAERVSSCQLASLEPVVPLARVRVIPADFPFLHQVRGHDEEELARRAAADPEGFPWRDD